MQDLSAAFAHALTLISSFDSALMEIVALSLRVSLLAVVAAAVIGLPLGALIATRQFPLRRLCIVMINSLMGLPPVVVGLTVYLLLSRSGPLGVLELLYTPTAMIIAQTILVAPIIAALTMQVIGDLHVEYSFQLQLFGASAMRTARTLLWDARFSLLTALLAGFGRAIAEVGAVLIVGGNINHATRVMTTAIALETSKGNLALALGLGIVLVALSVTINTLLLSVRGRAVQVSGA